MKIPDFAYYMGIKGRELKGQELSAVSLIEEFDNIIVFQTFSKAFGLAGIRLGYIVSNEENIEYLSKTRSLVLAVDSLIAFSKVPLRITTYIGLLAAAIAAFFMLVVLYWRLFCPNSGLSGVTIIIIAMFFLGAVQLISLGILGEYTGRIYDEVKARPLWTIKEEGGFVEKR